MFLIIVRSRIYTTNYNQHTGSMQVAYGGLTVGLLHSRCNSLCKMVLNRRTFQIYNKLKVLCIEDLININIILIIKHPLRNTQCVQRNSETEVEAATETYTHTLTAGQTQGLQTLSGNRQVQRQVQRNINGRLNTFLRLYTYYIVVLYMLVLLICLYSRMNLLLFVISRLIPSA